MDLLSCFLFGNKKFTTHNYGLHGLEHYVQHCHEKILNKIISEKIMHVVTESRVFFSEVQRHERCEQRRR